MQRSRHKTRERLRYDGDKEEELMRQFGLDYVLGPDGQDNVPVPEILACLIMEAGEWCNIGMYGSAVPLYEDALSLLNHFPNGPLRCEPIYWLRARCYYEMDHFEKVIQDCTQVINFDKGGTLPCTWHCYPMKVEAYLETGQIYKALETAYEFHIHCPWLPQATAIIGDLRRQLEAEERKRKKLGDKLIQEEQSKRRRTVRAKPPLMKKKKKKAKDPRTAAASKRGATNETYSNESDASSHSSMSDSEPQGLEGEEDTDQGALAMVGKSLPPISTHNRFVNVPEVETRKQKHTVTSTKRRNHSNVHVATRSTTGVLAATSPRHVREFPSMMIGKSQSHRSFSKREQPFQSPIVQATARTERRGVPYTSPTLRRAETSYPKRLFPTCLEDINKGNTAMQEAKCYYCQLQCNSKQQLQKHYQGKKHRAKLLSDDSDGMWQQRRPPPGVPGGQYKMCPYGFERCIHRTLCTYAHTKEELKEWQERYNIRKKTLNKAQSSGTYGYSFGERLAEEFKTKGKVELLSTTVQYARLLAEPEGTSVMFPERGREYTWTMKVQVGSSNFSVVSKLLNASPF
ncbi:uncharacterized protein LOC118427121 [Branchiostoma floridae]|uniref:Uncharacterized protein LOC118427121 n=1 Tax=Branchiostoma floridae TaxID=7739 RepID=A0A9J7M3W2_BRAFL|nr:uncharacterized protein LOC118427121 [Branchiostoma floridae]